MVKPYLRIFDRPGARAEQMVALGNGGAVDWAATDTVIVVASE